MDCCPTRTGPDGRPIEGAEEAAAPRTHCPSCGTKGRRVPPITLDSLVVEGFQRRDEPYRFCPSPDCDTAWFGEHSGHRIPRSASRVRIGQKERAADRPLCYCFGYSFADLAADVARTGGSSIPDEITARCRRGEDRCPETNPQGSCCLGNVRAALKSLLSKPPEDDPSVDACGCPAQPAR